ncbi:MAG: hypothetical protein EXS24_07425 [Pedosphaera sp.]|nr:hypothetical protein [Pedosphaera sp.]
MGKLQVPLVRFAELLQVRPVNLALTFAACGGDEPERTKMIDRVEQAADGGTATHKAPRKTDGSKFLTPRQVADRWAWHVESVRRAIRQRRIESVVISRRLLVPLAEVERIETEGRLARAA